MISSRSNGVLNASDLWQRAVLREKSGTDGRNQNYLVKLLSSWEENSCRPSINAPILLSKRMFIALKGSAVS